MAPLTSSFGLLLTALGHGVGWPVVQGGSAAIAAGLVSELESLGGTVVTGQMIGSLRELPPARVILLDTSPRQFLALAGPQMPASRARPWARFRPGPGTCKVDWALDGPVPWAAPDCRRAVTVHVGGTFEEVALSEAETRAGRHADRPFCLVVQPGLVDPSRAPDGRRTLWAYCHVPDLPGRLTNDRGSRSSASPPDFDSGSWPGSPARRTRPRRTIPISWAATSTGARPLSGRRSFAPCPAGTRSVLRWRGSTSARPPRHPAEGSMGCAGTGRRAPRSVIALGASRPDRRRSPPCARSGTVHDPSRREPNRWRNPRNWQ